MKSHVYTASRPVSARSDAQVHDAALAALSRRIVGRATGSTLPIGTRILEEPKQRLWLGMLTSEPEIREQAEPGRQAFREKITPPAQGFAFRTSELPREIRGSVAFSLYVGLHPTLEEQRREVEDAGTPGASPAGRAPANNRGYKLAAVWRKVHVGPVPFTLAVGPGETRPKDIEEAIAEAARQAVAAVPQDELYRPVRGSLPGDADLVDDAAWQRYSTANLASPGEVPPPAFRAAVHLEARSAAEPHELLLLVVNTTPSLAQRAEEGVGAADPAHTETRIYEVELTAQCPVPVLDYELEQVAHSYRYDREIPALGHACPVRVTHGEDGVTTLRTQFAAGEPTTRVHPRLTIEGREGESETIDARFKAFENDPVGTARRLVDLLDTWVEREWSSQALDRLAVANGWGAGACGEAEKAAAGARAEVKWLRAGVQVLESHDNIRKAFVAANQSMRRAANGFDTWRPFQIAWIIGCLPGVLDPESHQTVEILSFSTGGGKSEAYLGLMLVTLFYGRYTGVTAGSQVWARFPLRLLALQQAERFAKAVLNAELVRQGIPEIAAGAPFGLGYFVGSTNTPNKLSRPDPRSRYRFGANPDDPRVIELCRVLESCPLCRTRLHVRYDEESHTMRHICPNGTCEMAGPLPVWSVDDDIYRNAPSVLVGTVDKLALLAINGNFQILLGRAHSRCPRHGYGANPRFCAVFRCEERREAVGKGFGGLRLEIADELHLLEESLGALDGMYETLLHAINRKLRRPPFQIVGATATIEGYERQVDHLYKRQAHRFPVPGPRAGENFWATARPGDPLRQYVGVRPRAGTMITATREVAVAHAEWVEDMRRRPEEVATESGLDAADPRVVQLVQDMGEDLYEVLTAYCLRIEDLTSFARDQRVQEVAPDQNLVVINSDATTSEIQAAVRRLVDPPKAPESRVKVVVATKAIGHGFDVDRLGVMAVMGTPNQASEIIQASARVGRKYPGLVINVINPTRDRDASVYRYYAEWIRYLDRMVHKVPVNRESLPVLNRVMPGGLLAWVLQVYDRGWVTGGRGRKSLASAGEFQRAIESGYIERNPLIRDLAEGFGVHALSVYHKMHRDLIVKWVDDLRDTVALRPDPDAKLGDLLNPPVPMSLRDIEEPIVIYGQL
ncbi:helicase-related protein [Streptomyces sp. NPDC053474]|uniref:helicase-related protein n=1 Tax=Streptomyces sp. NPDC053474 TaxID=3365704 RepID=UPI0037D29FDF